MFIKNQTESDRLPPTQGALYEAILRAHYQIIVWNNDKVCCPSLPQERGKSENPEKELSEQGKEPTT